MNLQIAKACLIYLLAGLGIVFVGDMSRVYFRGSDTLGAIGIAKVGVIVGIMFAATDAFGIRKAK